MRIHPQMSWAVPYVLDARKLFNYNRTTQLKAFSYREGKNWVLDGTCIRWYGWYSINIRTTSNTGQSIMLEDAWFYLAHELAHTVHWEHTLEHTALMLRIFQSFVRTANRLGVTDTNVRLTRLGTRKYPVRRTGTRRTR